MKTQTDILLKNVTRLHKLIGNEKIIIDRCNDKYYVTDGYFAIEVTAEMYDRAFKSKCNYFVELNNKERAVIYPKRLEDSSKVMFTDYIVNLFNPEQNSCWLACKTGLSYKGSLIFLSNKSFVYSNEENIEVAERIIPQAVWYYRRSHNYFFTKYDSIAIISMEINPDSIKPNFEKILNAGGYTNEKTIQ